MVFPKETNRTRSSFTVLISSTSFLFFFFLLYFSLSSPLLHFPSQPTLQQCCCRSLVFLLWPRLRSPLSISLFLFLPEILFGIFFFHFFHNSSLDCFFFLIFLPQFLFEIFSSISSTIPAPIPFFFFFYFISYFSSIIYVWNFFFHFFYNFSL